MPIPARPSRPVPSGVAPGGFRAFVSRLRDHLAPLLRRTPGAPEEDLVFLKTYFANIVELSEDAIISVDATQCIRLFNAGAEVIFGYQAEEVLGRPLEILIPSSLRASHARHVHRFVEAPDAMRSMNERTQVAGLRRDGTEFPAEATISKFTLRGQPVLTVRLRDISHRRRTEEGLQRLAAIVESTDDAIFSVSASGTILTWNGGAERVFGFPAEEILGHHVDLLVPADRRHERSALMARVLAGESVSHFETVRFRKDGTPVDVSLSIAPLRDGSDAVVGMSAIGRDMTRHRLLERQLRQSQKMEAIGTLAGGIAHDFNNLLNVVTGHAELAALRLPNGSPAQAHLQEVTAASQHATDLVRQLLAFSRHSQPARRLVALQTVVEDLKHLLRASLPSTIDFRQQIDGAPAVVLADPTQIHQVLLNLCANAEHAMRERGGVLDLQLRSLDIDAPFADAHPPLRPGPHVKLTVRDTGHGIPAALLDRIFEPYFTTKPIGEGTGLGLAIVHSIVSAHGGAIAVDSAPERGTRFDLYLPRSESLAESLADALAPVRGEGERILLVDDEPSLVRLWLVALGDLGYRVTGYTNSREALEAFRETPDAFDLVITDQTMPQLTGEALAREIARMRPRLPVILCTGQLARPAGERVAPVGIRATLIKPVSRLDLSLAIQRVLLERAVARLSA